jgi:hypothetical protein
MAKAKTRKGSSTAKPTAEQFAAFQGMYDFFNRELFAGSLRPVILNFSRAANTLGFFAPERWEQADAKTHEISLNPAHLATRSPRDVASTLVHEMVHCWQQEHGKPSARGYHNKEWAAKMDEVGLVPSATGEPGGPRVGFKMTHYISDGGSFARAFERMPRDVLLPWSSWEPEGGRRGTTTTKSKLKYTCPLCGANAWGKPELHLVCGDDEERMVAEDE